MSEEIKKLFLDLGLPTEEATPFLGECDMYYYTYVVVPVNKKSSMYLKVYFGQHNTDKLDDGYIASGTKIKKYLKKYTGQFYRKILGFYNNTDELNQAEKELIDCHLNKDYCLNLKEGGDRAALSEESKKKLSDSLKGRTISDEWRKRISESHKDKHHSEETKKKMSESRKGRTISDEWRKRISDSNKGKQRSDEWRKRISESHKGKCTGENNSMYGKTGEKHPTSKKIEVDGVIYCSRRAAAKTIGVSKVKIDNLRKEGRARYI